MNTVKLQQRGLLTLPKKIRETLGLEDGQVLRIEEKAGKITLTPQSTASRLDLSQMIKQGIADLKEGHFIEFGSSKELNKKLPAFLKKYED